MTTTFDFTALIDGLETTHKVRVATLDGAPWFRAKDVCAVLGMDTAKGVTRWLAGIPADEKRTIRADQFDPQNFCGAKGRGGMRGSTPINVLAEPGLYRLLSLSRKPIAEPFKDWLYREVLPAIRKTGGYVLAGADPAAVEVGATEMMPLPTTFTEALRQHAAALIRPRRQPQPSSATLPCCPWSHRTASVDRPA